MEDHNSKSFLVGALLGGLLGGVGSVLFAPKAGKEIREELIDQYNHLGEKVKKIKRQGEELLHQGEELFTHHKKGRHHLCNVAMGAVLGSIIGAIAVLVLAPEMGKTLRETLEDQYDNIRHRAEEFMEGTRLKGHDAIEQIEDWKETLATLIDRLSSSHKNGNGHSKLDEIVRWANLGLSVWEQLQKRN